MEWHPGVDHEIYHTNSDTPENFGARLESARENLKSARHSDKNDKKQAEQDRHPLWDIDGIPEPTKADLKWAKKLEKKKSGDLKRWWKAPVKNGYIWRFAKLAEHASSAENACTLTTNYEFSVFCAKLEPEKATAIIKIAYASLKDCSNFIYSYAEHRKWECISVIAENEPEKIIRDYSYFNEKYPAFSGAVLNRFRWTPELFSHAIKHSPDLAQTAIHDHTILQDSDYYLTAKKQSDSLFIDMCKVKIAHEKLTGSYVDIPIADNWIEENLKPKAKTPLKPKQDKKWQKHEETSIWKNGPVDENGTRLRELFDFAARRVKEYQQMPDGTLNALNDWDFDDFSGFAHLIQAKAELEEQGGDASPDGTRKKPGVLSAKPL